VPRRAVRRSGMNTLDLMWVVCGTVLPSFLISWSAVRYVRRLAIRWQLVDRPGTRKVHTTPTPMGGGLAIWLGVVLPFAVGQLIVWLLTSNSQAASWLNPVIPAFARPHLAGLAHQAASLWVLLGGGTLLLIVGLVDDRFGISWRLRLGLQCVVATVCVLWQGWRLTAFIDVPWITWGLSVIWIVGLINSFNMLDNMDGLSAGVAAIAATMLAVVLFVTPDAQTRQPQIFVAGFLFVIVGALLGFLWHNRPPARIFMGDAGSYFVGFCIAVATLLATYTEYQGTRQHAVLAPLCVMAVPLYDMISVIWIRLREGRSPFQADKSHFSHRLVDLGLTKGQAVLTIYLTTATCGLGALLLHRVDLLGAMIVVLMIVCILGLIAILETTARRKLHS
jgi:UDP-GlcNAc:undecaprenyl-phosphate GlcNAc-1-phosphate transferase